MFAYSCKFTLASPAGTPPASFCSFHFSPFFLTSSQTLYRWGQNG
jgi:hypothetical protein